jgi:hypothetical protein
VCAKDEAGPFHTAPYPGQHRQPAGEPVRHPHEYVQTGTAKQLTLFCPASGQVRVKDERRTTTAVLHPWLEAELEEILATLPTPVEQSPASTPPNQVLAQVRETPDLAASASRGAARAVELVHTNGLDR